MNILTKIALVAIFGFALCFAQEPVEFIIPQQDTTLLLATDLAPEAVQNLCTKTYNINELLSKIKDGFQNKLKDCSSKLAKDMLTPTMLGGKKLEPKSFMMQCSVEGIKKELPDAFPNIEKILSSLSNFVQGILNSAIVDGVLDPKKLVSAVANANIEELLNEIKKLADDECVVDEPYEIKVDQREEAQKLYEKNRKKAALAWAVLNFYPGFGLGSYIQGNIAFGVTQSVLDVVATSVMFYYYPGPNSCSMDGFDFDRACEKDYHNKVKKFQERIIQASILVCATVLWV